MGSGFCFIDLFVVKTQEKMYTESMCYWITSIDT